MVMTANSAVLGGIGVRRATDQLVRWADEGNSGGSD